MTYNDVCQRPCVKRYNENKIKLMLRLFRQSNNVNNCRVCSETVVIDLRENL